MNSRMAPPQTSLVIRSPTPHGRLLALAMIFRGLSPRLASTTRMLTIYLWLASKYHLKRVFLDRGAYLVLSNRSSDGTKSFMLHWDGSKWNSLGMCTLISHATFADSRQCTSLGDALQGSASVSQLQMVPLSEDHDANSIIQKDRMLLVSGSLNGGSFGNASTALYDGKTFYPYITSTSQSGGPGLISGLFHSFTSFSFNHRRK